MGLAVTSVHSLSPQAPSCSASLIPASHLHHFVFPKRCRLQDFGLLSHPRSVPAARAPVSYSSVARRPRASSAVTVPGHQRPSSGHSTCRRAPTSAGRTSCRWRRSRAVGARARARPPPPSPSGQALPGAEAAPASCCRAAAAAPPDPLRPRALPARARAPPPGPGAVRLPARAAACAWLAW